MPKLLTSSKEKQNNFPEKAKLQQLISATIRWKSRESGRGKHALKHAGVRTRTRLNAGIHFLNPHSQIFTCLPGCLLHTNLHTHACTSPTPSRIHARRPRANSDAPFSPFPDSPGMAEQRRRRCTKGKVLTKLDYTVMANS